ncbi:MAG: hypothetical protein P8Z31_04060 [Gammaproteobacteria bacterium]
MNPASCKAFRILIMAASLSISGAFASGSPVCDATPVVKDATPDEIRDFFAKQKKSVVTFVGYSGSGYEDEKAMLAEAESALEEFDPSGTLVNIGATPDGIGAIYALARERGFVTTGIVSSQARKYGISPSACVDYVFYVEDATWGGYTDNGKRLAPTSRALVENSDILIGIGGGEVARDELMAARSMGKEVRFIAADMNHAKVRAKASKKGLPQPQDFRGTAHEVFGAE